MKIGLRICPWLFYFISISMQSCVAKIVQERSIDTTTSHLICKSSVSTLVCLLPTLRKNKIKRAVLDPDLEIWSGDGAVIQPLDNGGLTLQRKFFPPFEPQLGLKIRGEPAPPPPVPPLDPPLESAILKVGPIQTSCYCRAEIN